MSAANAKNKNNAQPALVTTGKGAAVAVTFGITLLVLGIAWLIAPLAGGNSYVLNELTRALQGLAGPLCLGLPILLCWGGAKLLVSARHRVSIRDYALLFAIYLVILAVYTLIARVNINGAAITFMDFVGRQNYKNAELGFDSLSAYLRQAFQLRSSGTGGLLGMLIAYPVWRILGPILGAAFVIILLIILFFVLLRLNPGDFFRSAAEKNEQRQQEKNQHRAAQQHAQPMPQPSAPAENRASPLPEETVCPEPPSYYQPAPIYDAYTVQQVQKKDQKGFYTVTNDLYDEHFPLHTDQKSWQDLSSSAQEEWSQPAPANSEYTPPVFRYEDDAITQEKDVLPEAPIDPVPETMEADDLPWETEQGSQSVADNLSNYAEKKHVKTQDIPEAKNCQPQETKKASGMDWASLVRQKKAALTEDDELPQHTTAKGEPKPVYTDPVMPITRERISISPRSGEKREDEKLDGTLSPKPQQGKMELSIPYEAPPMRLLNESRHVPMEDAAQEDQHRAQIIESTLGSFGVESKVKQIMHGPSITRFAIQIAPGVKVSRVANTADNLALDLKTKHVRVEAPIQGTSYIGIEVPNALVSTVSLREVLDSPEMAGKPSPLLVALGKDIAGAPILCDLSKMPHLLIAGATGSGKSVCINSIVCSLLYRTSPDQVRLIMIDPKQVELSVYNGIPHLLVPVISDPRKAAGALAWVVQEMTERYGKFTAQGVRNLAGYNKENQGTDKVLPNIVVIIDEMADLMEVCRKDVEESIRRLAALARAAGIYMVLATQRPSVDVITGVVKNNIPSRIAFAVSSGTDSRTIIDINGAEKLMGKGDMLYKPAGASPLRVQGCLVTDDEVKAVADYISRRYEADYDPNIIEHLENTEKEKLDADEIGGEEDSADNGERSVDDLLAEAIEMAVEDGQTSTSMLQRRLRIGYARAGRLVDEMEKRGIVSHSEGSKPRKTLMTREQYYENLSDISD